MEGVVAAVVSYDDKIATVRYDPDQVTTQQMIEAVDATGFSATLRDSDPIDNK